MIVRHYDYIKAFSTANLFLKKEEKTEICTEEVTKNNLRLNRRDNISLQHVNSNLSKSTNVEWSPEVAEMLSNAFSKAFHGCFPLQILPSSLTLSFKIMSYPSKWAPHNNIKKDLSAAARVAATTVC